MTVKPLEQPSDDRSKPGGRVLLLRLSESIARTCQSAASTLSFDSIEVDGLEEAGQLSDAPVPTCLVLPDNADYLRALLDSKEKNFRCIATVVVQPEGGPVDLYRHMGQPVFSVSAARETVQIELSYAIKQAAYLQCKWSTIEDFQQRLARLTPEELVVLEAVCLGDLNRKIANTVGVSIRTIEQRRQQVFEKMGVGSAVPLATQLAIVKTLTHPFGRKSMPHAFLQSVPRLPFQSSAEVSFSQR